ncbi:Glycoside hydrolase protein [Pseudomonas cichorii]|uniref:Glycoside hydrolase protein n=1 Tax=Pseudomonas cichorii TaxID=36746 RepID=A0A3M4M8K5_PSECI|nr:cellulase family glycosylhydrolase [Pseudomonas cichorii]RMQ50142.1 Glycoside hydrolase protein [Pseudomonas cichorii]
MQRKSRSWLAIAAVLSSAITLGSAAQASTVLQAPRAVVWKDFLGVNVQFQYFAPEIYKQQMARLDTLGLNWVRLTIHWPIIEPAQDQYNLADLDGAMAAIKSHGYNTLAYLVGSAPFASNSASSAASRDQYPPKDFNVFAARMTALAQRYEHVNNWQVWNEPNIIWLPQADPVAYGNLLTTTATAIRSVLPNKTIVTAGMAYYSQMQHRSGYMLQTLLENGLGSQNIVAAYHPYSEYPEGDSPESQDFLKRANAMNQMLHSNGVAQVWATEWGWSSYNGPVEMQALIGIQGQADYTLRRLALMSAMDFQRIFLFNLSDLDERASARDQGYGLLDLQANPKPVYTALQNFLNITGPRLEPATAPAMNQAPNDLYAVPWTRSDGKRLLMFWSASGSTLNFPQINEGIVHDPLTGSRIPLSGSQGISLALKPSLQILEWNP